MANKIVTHKHRLHVARQFVESVNEVSNTAYYMFMGGHMPRANTDDLTISETEQTTLVEAYRNMIQGKRVGVNDVRLMIRNIPYETNKVFTMYDDSDADLLDEDYYAIVNASSYSHVYKCLDNNMGANSTQQPNFAHISGSNSQVYQTSDGYRWKYMYSVSSSVRNTFATADFFPVVANTEVESSAVDGVLDIILVEGTGRGYHNYLTGTLGATDLRINSNNMVYKVGNTSASSTNGFYTGCLFYISSGTGAGSYATVEDYFVNENGNFVVLDAALQENPVNGSEYQIYPEVIVSGSGSETVNVVARALVNASNSNSVYRVEVIDRGENWEYFTANVVANAVVGVIANAEVRPIYAPFGGHGADAAAELGARRVCVSTKFSNSESNTILTDNGFGQIGLLKDPLFNDVKITLEANIVGTFVAGEYICKVAPVRINTNATMNTVSDIVSCNSADFENQVSVGSCLYLGASDGSAYQLATVATVTNSSQIVLGNTGLFSCTQTEVYLANKTADGYVGSVNSGTVIHMANVAGIIQTDDLLIGQLSGARAWVNTVARNDVAKTFNSYIQLYKYTGTLTSGSYQENEVVYQQSLAHANAALHSVYLDGGSITLYTSNQTGAFDVGGIELGTNTIIGNTSGAIAEVTGKYAPELVFGSGQVLYLENINTVDRAEDQSEILKLILEF